MAIDVSGDDTRGLIVPDLRLGYSSISTSLSSFTQAGPLPGVPEAQGETEMVLEASGTQSAGKKLRIRAVRAGQPKPDGGAFAWRYVGDDLWRGWDGPHQVAYFEFIDYTTTANKWKHPHAITLSDGAVVAVVVKSDRYVVAQVRNATSGAWSEVEVYDRGSSYAHSARPTVLAIPSGRLLCLFWVEDAASATNQVRMHYSDDGGATWTLGNKACLSTALDSIGVDRTPKTLRAAYLNGQVLLVAWVTDTSIAARADVLYQYASSDLAASFSLVGSDSGADDSSWAAYPSVFATDGQLFVHYITRDTTTTGSIVPKQKRLANAYQLLSAITPELACQSGNPMKWGNTAGGGPPLEFTAGDLASWADEDGVLYMAGRDHDVAGGALDECYVQRSIDGGATWAAVGSGAAPGAGAGFWRGQDTATTFDGFTGTAQGGRAVLVHTFQGNPDNHDDSLCATYLGGYTTVTLPGLTSFPTPKERVAWERTWLPFDLPENTGGIFGAPALTGAPTIILTSLGVNITAAAGEAASWALGTAPTSTLAQGMIAMIDVLATAGTAILQLQAGVAGPASYTVRVSITPTAITLTDLEAGVDIATIATTAGASGVQVLLAVGNDTAGAPGNDGQVAAWYRPTGSGTDREFIELGSSSALELGANTSNALTFGLIAAGGARSVTTRQVCYSYGDYAGEQLYAGQANPSDLQGRSFSATPEYVDDGVKVAAVDGPAFYADNWNIDTRYEYGIENLFPDVSPSPDREWRSVNTASEQLIVLEYDEALAERTPPLEPSIGFALLNINFQTCYFEGWTGAAWEVLATVNSAVNQEDMKFTRYADTVVSQGLPTVYAGAVDWQTYHVLADSYFRMHLSGDQGYTQIRKIRTNSEGAFSNATTKRAVIELYGVQPSDSSGGVLPFGAIMSKDVAVVVNATTRYTRLRLRIPPQTTCEGYFKIGAMPLGHVVTFARQYSRGRALRVEPNTSITTSRSGARRARRLGAARRAVEFAWTDGVDVTQATTSNPAADYVTAYAGSSVPSGSPHDTPYAVAGVADQIDGGLRLLVYLPGFPRPANGDAVVLNNRNKFLYSRMVSAVRLESRVGSEWGNPGELFNVATTLLEEEK